MISWYTPAETKIPLTPLLRAIFPGGSDFGRRLSDYLGVEKCVFAKDARTLLFLLLARLHEQTPERDEVLIPGYTCYSVAAAVAKAGLKVSLYDLDPNTLEPDIDSARGVVSHQTLAIVAQHLFGIPTPFAGLKELAQESGAHLIEDAAQALGGTLDGQPLGTNADFGFFSFGRGKPLPLGCGGALIGKTTPLFGLLNKSKPRGLTSLIATILAQVMANPLLYWISEALPLGLGETKFDPNFDTEPMPSMFNILGAKTLPFLETLNTHRRMVANVFNATFQESQFFPVPNGSLPVYTRYPLRTGHATISKKNKTMGIRRMYPKPICQEGAIRPHLANNQGDTPGAAEIAENLVTLPTHHRISGHLARRISSHLRAEQNC